MATDAQVKEIALLKEYANRLDGFKDAILGGCMVLQNKAEAILDNLQNESNYCPCLPLFFVEIPTSI